MRYSIKTLARALRLYGTSSLTIFTYLRCSEFLSKKSTLEQKGVECGF